MSIFIGAVVCMLVCGTRLTYASLLEGLVDRLWQNNPDYLRAHNEVQVGREQVRQALAPLLPQVHASVGTFRNNRDYEYNRPDRESLQDKYNSNSLELNIQQTLWQRANRLAYDQTLQQTGQVEIQLNTVKQNLLLQLIETWLAVLHAADNASVAQLEVHVKQRTVQQLSQEYQAGMTPLQDLTAAKLALQQAEAELSIAEYHQAVQMSKLEQLVGPLENAEKTLVTLKAYTADHSKNLQSWLQQAEEHSLFIKEKRQALNIVRLEAEKQRAGHEPVVSLVVNYSKNKQGAGISGGQTGFDSKNKSIGLQVNAPLYTGGSQSARVREVEARINSAHYELLASIRNVQQQVKLNWFELQSAIATQSATDTQVTQAELLLQAAREEHQKGVKVKLDVMQAELALQAALRDRKKASYDMMRYTIGLHNVSGTLTRKNVLTLEQYFSSRDNESQGR